MIPGTTPTLTLTIKDPNLDLRLADNVYVTIKQTGYKLTLTGNNVSVPSATVVKCFLSQEESLKLSSNVTAQIQINWIYTDDLSGKRLRGATKPKTINIEEQLLKQVI